MKHQLFGEFNLEELREVIGLLEVQDTIDRSIVLESEMNIYGEHGNYFIRIDEFGNTEVYNEV